MPKVNPYTKFGKPTCQTRLELSRGQKCYGRTDRRTGTGDDNTLPAERPKGKNIWMIRKPYAPGVHYL